MPETICPVLVERAPWNWTSAEFLNMPPSIRNSGHVVCIVVSLYVTPDLVCAKIFVHGF